MQKLITTKQSLTVRSDPAGDGAFGASRDGGARTHNGIDYCVAKGDEALSPVDGTISKHGVVYGDDHQWTYVQITDSRGRHHRIMYVEPIGHIGKAVKAGETVVGIAQAISERYAHRGSPLDQMHDHIHYEVVSAGVCVDPEGLA